ncbi:hypothetical protein SAMN05421547_13317 [Delftia lacustris]|uniref:Uncharacterized protein n=1 Tax=Delftia lacustris TaxID=558537 RepID=A0A1H3TW39_9BURK|nr:MULTISPECIES: hypothetical protein [Delftia]SDZ54287.1 hypothetical protein SAMN05421547_13317 [Delftia lacustris]
MYTLAVVGAYWISCMRLPSSTKLPGLGGDVTTDLENLVVGHGHPALDQVVEKEPRVLREGAAAVDRRLDGFGIGGQAIGRARSADDLAQCKPPLGLAVFIQRHRRQGAVHGLRKLPIALRQLGDP